MWGLRTFSSEWHGYVASICRRFLALHLRVQQVTRRTACNTPCGRTTYTRDVRVFEQRLFWGIPCEDSPKKSRALLLAVVRRHDAHLAKRTVTYANVSVAFCPSTCPLCSPSLSLLRHRLARFASTAPPQPDRSRCRRRDVSAGLEPGLLFTWIDAAFLLCANLTFHGRMSSFKNANVPT